MKFHDTEHEFRMEVIADDSGKYCGNGVSFDTVESAEEYAWDLSTRWTLVRAWRVLNKKGRTISVG